MKRNKNRKNRNWRNFAVLTLVCMLVATLVGCKESEAVTPEPSTSEVVSEPISEPVYEEVSEIVSEEPSEEIIFEEPSEETMDLTPYSISNGKFIVDLVADMDYDEPKIIVWGEDAAKEILSDGDSYQIEEHDSLCVYCPEEMTNIEVNTDNIVIYGIEGNRTGFGLSSYGENMEVIFTITDEDGNEYEITVYLTQKFSE